MEICQQCGKSVSIGSGKFVNRIPDLDTLEERKERNVPHPEGDYICEVCGDWRFKHADDHDD